MGSFCTCEMKPKTDKSNQPSIYSENLNISRTSDDEQKMIFSDQISDESSPSQLFYLDSHWDILGNLPPEIVEKILYHLDLTTFTNCTKVCKQWYSIISSNYRLWQVACQKLGLSVKRPQFPDVEPDYMNIFLRMRNLFTEIQTDGAVLQTETIEAAAECMHNHKGIIAIANKNTITLWRVEPRLCVVVKIVTSAFGRWTSLHFDDSFLVAGTETGQLFVWELPAAKILYCQEQHRRFVSSLTFNKDIDLLITASNCVSFWCLSTGQLIRSDVGYIYRLVVQLHLAHIPPLQNGHDYIFICHTAHPCFLSAYSFDSKCISATPKRVSFVVDRVKYPDYLVLPNSYVSGCFFYFMTGSHRSPKLFLHKWDLANGIMANGFEIMGQVELVAVGKKYACLLPWQTKMQMQRVIIYDISTETEFATVAVPKIPVGLLKHGDTSWLDGFDGFNDKDVFLIGNGSYCTLNAVNNFKWMIWHPADYIPKQW